MVLFLALALPGCLSTKGPPPQDSEAELVRLLHIRAEQGNARDQFLLGHLYYDGRDGIPQDYARAVSWYRMAAVQGDADAQNRLGRAYALGEGVPQDSFEAARWWRRAAEQGHGEAQGALGRAHIYGHGVIRDREAGCRMLRSSAEQGSSREAIEAYNKHCAR